MCILIFLWQLLIGAFWGCACSLGAFMAWYIYHTTMIKCSEKYRKITNTHL